MLKTYHPEMKEQKPVAQIEASLSHYGNHWFLRTPLQLKGRGITFRGTITAEQVRSERLVGWHEYKVTEAAFERICEQYDVVSECLL